MQKGFISFQKQIKKKRNYTMYYIVLWTIHKNTVVAADQTEVKHKNNCERSLEWDQG